MFLELPKINLKKQQGMTLIEVLVAATILFSFLVVMTQVMGTASISSDQAEKNITITLNMPFIVDEIENNINAGKFSSKGELAMAEVSYQWRASPQMRHSIWQSPLQTNTKKRYVSLYNVELDVSYKTLQKTFSYVEVVSEK